MAASPTIYNGNRTITFNILDGFVPQMLHKGAKPLPFPHGQGQQVVAVLQWQEIYPIKFLFKTNGTLPWDQYIDFLDFLKEESDLLGHVKIDFDKPGDNASTPARVTWYGKIQNVTVKPINYPQAIESVAGNFNFMIDDKTDVTGW